MRAARNAVCAVLATAALAVGHDARASHPPDQPEIQQILVDPSRARAVALGLRFGGYVLSRAGVAPWSSVCPAALGYEDTETYPGVALADGSLVMSIGLAGIARSHGAGGCEWSAWQPDFPAFFADLRGAPGDASRLFALSSSPEGAGFTTELWSSTDGGGSWQPFGVRFASDVAATSFAVSANNAARWYLAGSASSGAALLRSDDAAVTWKRLAIENAGVPRVVGVGAADSVVVRLDGHQHDVAGPTLVDRILVSYDAGEHFESLFTAGGDLSAAALSDDGRLAFGGPDDGLWTASLPSGRPMRHEVPERSTVQALAWSGGRLYAGIRAPSGALSLVTTDDGGGSFASVVSLCEALTPLACPAASGAAGICTGDTAAQVSLTADALPWCNAPPAIAPPASKPPAREVDETAGCSVAAEPHAPRGGSALLVLFALSLFAARSLTGRCPIRAPSRVIR